MIKIDKVTFNGKTIELAIPVYLSDDEVQYPNKIYDRSEAVAAANAEFVFYIIQKQIEQLMAEKEKEEK